MDARIWLTGGWGAALGGACASGRTVVGRDPEADVSIDDEAVSWNHLEIESRGGVLMATDLDSRNGTALNGEPLDRPRRLRDGDTLIVGGHRLEVSDPLPGHGRARPSPAASPSVALSEEERATATALVAPYRSEGAFAGRPATRAEIADALHVSERTAQRRLDALAAKLDVPGDAGRDRPRLIAARVIELGLDRASLTRAPVELGYSPLIGRGISAQRPASWLGPGQTWPGGWRGCRWRGRPGGRASVGSDQPTEREVQCSTDRSVISALLALLALAVPATASGGAASLRRRRLLAHRRRPAKASPKAASSPPATATSTS